ncbi:MAG TPA: amidohydrolase family protein [Acidimicrobiales bacterium]|nr:amidohydrolase family protein [Acidimicrobiales bacterium]
MADTTPGLVCGHHHLYSALARGMPAPPRTPTTFLEILEQIWWRLDVALDPEMLRWSAMLGALEALECGTTAIVDHHEGPSSIEGSLDVIAAACAEVGVRVRCCYGVTDRHGPDGARRGLEENERFLRSGGAGMVGVHAAFTCSDETLHAAAGLAAELGVGVHVHVAEGTVDVDAPGRLGTLVQPDWLVAHGVHLPRPVPEPFARTTLAHCARSNMHNAVGYAHPRSWPDRVVLGSDGIGADMLEEFRIAYVNAREHDVTATPEEVWAWVEEGWALVPEALGDRVRWSYGHTDDPWRLAFTPGVRALDVWVDGEQVLDAGRATRVDPREVRARAAEQAARLFERL